VTKAEIVNEVSNRTGLEKVEAQRTVDAFLDVVKDAMQDGQNIYFRGFGSFIVKRRARKVARNIAENTSMVIEPHYIPTFKPSRTFVDLVKEKVHDDMMTDNNMTNNNGQSS
jgi:DNA-binding protein HU-beta